MKSGSQFRLQHQHFILDAFLEGPLDETRAEPITRAFVADLLRTLGMSELGSLGVYAAADERAPGWSFIQPITTSHISGHYFVKPGKGPHIRLDVYSCEAFHWLSVVMVAHKHFKLADWAGTFLERELDGGERKAWNLSGTGDHPTVQERLTGQVRTEETAKENVQNSLTQAQFLRETVEHIDVKSFNAAPMVESMKSMSFQARNLAKACGVMEEMIKDKDCAVILCLAGSLISSGLKKALRTLVECNIVDAIVSTGANMVDMDFFEGLGFRHYIGDPKADDHTLQQLGIDRIYDTYISENELRVCDASCSLVADRLPKRPHSSREYMAALGAYLQEQNLGEDSLLRLCYEKQVPIFVPSLSDCSAGFGLTYHQKHHPEAHFSHDSVKDFSELTTLVANSGSTGMCIIGGGVPKNFTADTVVCADVLGLESKMHKYAIQITVADERDGALSGSTLREAHSWGKVETYAEQMVYCEATIAVPLLASHAYHREYWRARGERRLGQTFAPVFLQPEQASMPGKQELLEARAELTSSK